MYPNIAKLFTLSSTEGTWNWKRPRRRHPGGMRKRSRYCPIHTFIPIVSVGYVIYVTFVGYVIYKQEHAEAKYGN